MTKKIAPSKYSLTAFPSKKITTKFTTSKWSAWTSCNKETYSVLLTFSTSAINVYQTSWKRKTTSVKVCTFLKRAIMKSNCSFWQIFLKLWLRLRYGLSLQKSKRNWPWISTIRSLSTTKIRAISVRLHIFTKEWLSWLSHVRINSTSWLHCWDWENVMTRYKKIMRPLSFWRMLLTWLVFWMIRVSELKWQSWLARSLSRFT